MSPQPAPQPLTFQTVSLVAALATGAFALAFVYLYVTLLADLAFVDGGESRLCASWRNLGAYRGRQCVAWEAVRRDVSDMDGRLAAAWGAVVGFGAASAAWGRGPRPRWARWRPALLKRLAAAAAAVAVVEGAVTVAEQGRLAEFAAGELPAALAARVGPVTLSALAAWAAGVWWARRRGAGGGPAGPGVRVTA